MGEPKTDQNPKLSVAPPAEDAAVPPKGMSLKVKLGSAAFVVFAALLFKPAQGLMVDILFYEKTDDAQIAGTLHYVSTKVAGVVSQVNFEDYSSVKKGDVLVQLDLREFEHKVKQLQIELNLALLKFENAKRDLERVQNQSNATNLEPAKLKYKEMINAYWIAKTKLDQANLELEYASVRAPCDGKVGKREVGAGSLLRTFQAVTSMICGNERWVVANFKETQLGNVRVGQEVNIEVDSIKDKIFTGRVGNIAPTSGASVALIPPDNATGNFTKIVQRIPVKIFFDPNSIAGFEDYLIPGSSVVAKVRDSK